MEASRRSRHLAYQHKVAEDAIVKLEDKDTEVTVEEIGENRVRDRGRG